MKKYREEVPDGRFFARKQRVITSDDGHEVTLGFEWQGGAYIEVSRGHAFGNPKEVINVWEYASDSPRIPRTKQAMGRAIDDWISNYGRDNLIHDVTTNW